MLKGQSIKVEKSVIKRRKEKDQIADVKPLRKKKRSRRGEKQRGKLGKKRRGTERKCQAKNE